MIIDPPGLAEALAGLARRAARTRQPAPRSLPGLEGLPGAQLRALGELFGAAGRAVPAAPDEIRQWLNAESTVTLNSDDQALLAAANADTHPEELFAAVYEQLVSPARRRRIGTYFTPRHVVEFMIEAAGAALSPGSVVDAGAGVGALTTAAATRWPKAELHAVDVNSASLGLLALAMQQNRHDERLRLHCEDYLQWVDAGWRTAPAPRLLLANPPYTRHQTRTIEEKKIATDAAGSLISHHTASLASYVTASTLGRFDAGDAMCVLLPDNWLEAAYGLQLRDHLWRLTHRRVDLFELPEQADIFPDARVRAIVLTVGPDLPDRQALTIHKVSVQRGRLRATRSSWRYQREVGSSDPLRWLWKQRAGALSSGPPKASGTRLGELVKLSRGIATGANAVFLLRHSDAGRLGIESCRRSIHRLYALQGDLLDDAAFEKLCLEDARCWLLDVEDPGEASGKVRAWLDDAESADVHRRVLCSMRKVWTQLEFSDPPRAIVGPTTSRAAFRIIDNQAQAHITNNLFGVWPWADGPRHEDAAWTQLLTWLRTDDAQGQWRALARTHSGGLRKLEPREARSIVVPASVAAEFGNANR